MHARVFAMWPVLGVLPLTHSADGLVAFYNNLGATVRIRNNGLQMKNYKSAREDPEVKNLL